MSGYDESRKRAIGDDIDKHLSMILQEAMTRVEEVGRVRLGEELAARIRKTQLEGPSHIQACEQLYADAMKNK